MAKMAMQGVLLLSIVAALLSGAATAASIRDGRLPPSALEKFTQSKGHWNRGIGPREVKTDGLTPEILGIVVTGLLLTTMKMI